MKIYISLIILFIASSFSSVAQKDSIDLPVIQPYIETVDGDRIEYQEVKSNKISGKIIGVSEDGSKTKYKTKELFFALKGKKIP